MSRSRGSNGYGQVKGMNAQLSSRPVEEVLATYSQSQCADWRDKVYGLLSLVENGHEFPVDYSVDKMMLLAAVLRFQPDKSQWLSTAKLMMNVLGISNLDLLQYDLGCQATRDHTQNSTRWDTAQLRLTAVLDQSSLSVQGESSISYPDGPSRGNDILSLCTMQGCLRNPGPKVRHGDRFYLLVGGFLINEAHQEAQAANAQKDTAYQLVRPHFKATSEYEYPGTISKQSLSEHYVGLEFVLHSLHEYELRHNMALFSTPDTASHDDCLLELSPPTLGLLIRSLSSERGGQIKWKHHLPVESAS